MSRTCSLVCHDCKIQYWCGQASSSGYYIYNPDYVADFLFQHTGHNIQHLDDEFFPNEAYEYTGIHEGE